MNIEQINTDKIKVTVDESDQKEFGVTYESMNYSNSNTRKLCEKIMAVANKQIGFCACGAKLLVEARRSLNNTVTLYISRIPNDPADKHEYFCQTVCFEDVNALLDSCRLFQKIEQEIQTSDLMEYENKYYLYFEIYSTAEQAKKLLLNLLEYATNTPISDCMLKEHGTIITEYDAIPELLKTLK